MRDPRAESCKQHRRSLGVRGDLVKGRFKYSNVAIKAVK